MVIITSNMLISTAIVLATMAFTTLAQVSATESCVQKQDFCLVRPALDVMTTCNQFRNEVALPACQATASQRLTFAAIGQILNASPFGQPFYETCNCECPSVSNSTYVRDTRACFDRAFLASTGNCPTTQSLTCSQIQTVLCPDLPFRYTGGTFITC